MKKLLAIVLAVLMCFALASCSSTSDPTETPTEPSSISPPSNSTPESSTDSVNQVEVDEGLLDVTITLPAALFENEENFDAQTYKTENNFKDVKVNDDGSVSITMSKGRHNEVLADMRASLQESFDELIESDLAPYVKAITPDENYSTVIIDVDKTGYESAFAKAAPVTVGLLAITYQQYANIENHCDVIIRDIDTGKEIETFTYPKQ